MDCLLGRCFLVCISSDKGEFEHGIYYTEKANIITSELKWAGVEAKWWNISGHKYIVIQGKIDHSSHYSDIKMKSVSRRQLIDDFAMRFDSISRRLSILRCDITHASKNHCAIW